MTRFDVLQAMTDVEEYARHVWHMAHSQESETDFKKLLMSELSEDGRQCMLNAARSGHPLSLERLQFGIEKYERTEYAIPASDIAKAMRAIRPQ